MHAYSPEPGFTSARLGDGGDLVKPNRRCLNLANWMSDQEVRESRAASLVCRALAVNAWRKKRTQVVELESTVSDLGQQLDHLQMQIVVLRKLLDKENSRVSGLGAELHKTKAQLEEAIKDRDQFKSVSIFTFLPLESLQLLEKLFVLIKIEVLNNENVFVLTLQNKIFRGTAT